VLPSLRGSQPRLYPRPFPDKLPPRGVPARTQELRLAFIGEQRVMFVMLECDLHHFFSDLNKFSMHALGSWGVNLSDTGRERRTLVKVHFDSYI
jgi:hypothetical protein